MTPTCLGCGHAKRHHINGVGLCLVASCRLCLSYRPTTTNTTPPPGYGEGVLRPQGGHEMSVEPSCTHKPTVRVSSHADLAAACKTPGSGPMASVYCCDREPCRKKATFWVQGETGRTAVVVPLPTRAVAR